MPFETFKTLTFRVLSTAMVILWMVIIYSYSAQPAEESTDLSGTVSYDIVSGVSNLFHLEWEEDTLLSHAELIEFPVRKAAHMSEYAVLAGFGFLMLGTYGLLGAKGTLPGRLRYIFSALIVFLYACTDEYHQTFVEGRTGQFVDVCVDMAGAVILLLLLMIYMRWKEKRHKKSPHL